MKVFCVSWSGCVVWLDVMEDGRGGTTMWRTKAWSSYKTSSVLDMCVDVMGMLLCMGSVD